MKYVSSQFADPDVAAPKLAEIANGIEAVQDGRIYIEPVNGAFLEAGGTPDQYRAALARANSKGWLWRHESGFTPAGAESDGLDDRRHKPRRRELLNQVVRLLFRNISPGGSNSTAHLLGLFCCYTKLISQKFGLQLHHFVYVLGIH